MHSGSHAYAWAAIVTSVRAGFPRTFNLRRGMQFTYSFYINRHLNCLATNIIYMKNRKLAVILAIALGGFGAHKFYLGKNLWGIIYLLFCWTGIPTIISLIEGILFLVESDLSFNRKYWKGKLS